MSTPHEDATARAAEWLRENAPPEPVKPEPARSEQPPSSPPPAAEPGSHAEPVERADDDDESDDQAPAPVRTPERMNLAAKLALVGWTLLDTYVPKQFGAHMKLAPAEKAELVQVTAPVIESRLPSDLNGEMTEEELLLSTVVTIYGSKLLFAPEPAAQQQEPPSGGGGQEHEGSGASGIPTDAKVDGRPVEATVHEFKKKAGT